MELFWREHRLGLQLILSSDGGEEVVGTIRRTPRGYDAAAKTLGYDPGRAEKGMGSLEESRAFVESFRPWEQLIGSSDQAVEPGVRSREDTAAAAPHAGESQETPSAPAEDAPAEPEPPGAPAEPGPRIRRRWWEFWKSG